MNSSASFFDSVKNWFASESAEAKKTKDDIEKRLDKDLSRRESELSATPEERLERIQEQIDGNKSAFDNIRAKIDTSTTQAQLDPSEADPKDVT